jgi:hypothetical protein
MQLCCKCENSWEYKGTAEVYACCPKCKSKVKIDSDDVPMRLERWAVKIPLELSLPEDPYQACKAFFKDKRPGPYSHIALASVVRHNYSNYDDLIFQLESKSLKYNSHPNEVMAAYQILRERFDRQICKLVGRCRCGQVLRNDQKRSE